MKRFVFLLCLVIAAHSLLCAQPQSISKKTAGMEKYLGYFSFYWDAKEGKIWLEIDKFNMEFLYVNSLRAGVGSNNIGLDRNQLGRTRIVKFERVGPKVLLVQPNYSFRAISDNPDERRAVDEAFAQSVIWGFQVEAEAGGRVIVDASRFFLKDTHNVIEGYTQCHRLSQTKKPGKLQTRYHQICYLSADDEELPV
jgi:hypothetical protein